MNKPTVHYLGTPINLMNKAILHPVDHPDHLNVSNTKEVVTSDVVSWCIESGRIETKNTIYIPLI